MMEAEVDGILYRADDDGWVMVREWDPQVSDWRWEPYKRLAALEEHVRIFSALVG